MLINILPEVGIEVLIKSKYVSRAPILIQGALDIEIDWLIGQLSDVKKQKIASWSFWSGKISHYPVIISRTEMGLVNVSTATTIAIQRFQPRYIINQGTAGAHVADLHVGDIVIGTKSINIGAIQTPFLSQNQGSYPLKWDSFPGVMNLRDEQDLEEFNTFFEHDHYLQEIMFKTASSYNKGKVVQGIIGSSDVWNREVDRILWFHTRYETIIEEMESSAVGQVAKAFNIPFVGVRVVTNSDINAEEYTPSVAVDCQRYVYQAIKSWLVS